jgi:hypothetical protein
MTDLERLKEVQKDCEFDATRIDGKPATGRVLGEMFGGILASVDCLAKVLQNTIQRIENLELVVGGKLPAPFVDSKPAGCTSKGSGA